MNNASGGAASAVSTALRSPEGCPAAAGVGLLPPRRTSKPRRENGSLEKSGAEALIGSEGLPLTRKYHAARKTGSSLPTARAAVGEKRASEFLGLCRAGGRCEGLNPRTYALPRGHTIPALPLQIPSKKAQHITQICVSVRGSW